MKYISGIYHSIRCSYVGWFGGDIIGGIYYIWWPIHLNINKNSLWKDCTIVPLRKIEHVFIVHK